ncbi:MAG: NMT1/THI5-like protein [Firmicutes bacterium]|nr:NMT1/THI5-like protein [Bacillota bacterium]
MKKPFSLLCAALLSAGLLSGCGAETPPAASGGDTDNTPLESIVFTEPVRGYHWAPAYLAQTLGYFADEGLDAEFLTVSGADSSTPVFTGDAQFGLRGVEMALMSNEAGQGCKILVSTTGRYPYQLIGANENYGTVESLRGQTVAGGQGPSSAPQAFIKAILLHGDIIPVEETAVISMASAGYLAALSKGEIQAAVSTNPWSARQLLDAGGVVIVDGADEAAMEDLMGTSTYELFTIFTSDAYIAENPETVQKTVNAIARAIDWMNEASSEEIAKNLEPLFEGQYDELLFSAEADQERGLHTATGYHTESGFAAALALTKLSGGISGDLPAEKIYDESFLQNAWDAIEK